MKIGIDLGSSNTLAAVQSNDGAPALIPDVNRAGVDFTPSKVLIGRDRVYVGYFAERMIDTFPDQTLVTHFKRHFGSHRELANFKGQALTSEALAALVLRKIRHDVEISTSRPIEACVITAPAHFNDNQRRTILNAAKLADVRVGAILDEPIAAALFYTHTAQNIDDEIIVVYDLGGGTFDLTVLTYSQGKLHIIAKGGLSNLGGRDFDEIVYQQLAHDYRKVMGHAPERSQLSENKLRGFAEQLKLKVDGRKAGLTSDYLFLNHRLIHFQLDETHFLSEASRILDKTHALVVRTLKGIGMQLSDVQRIVLTGGASNADFVRTYWEQHIDPTRQKLLHHQPLSSIAKGAAIYASSLKRQGDHDFMSSYSLNNVSAYNVGILNPVKNTFLKLIDKNLPLPVHGRGEINRAQNSITPLNISLCQYIDQPEELDIIGYIQIDSRHLDLIEHIEVMVENKSDGTLALRLRKSGTSEPIPFNFTRSINNPTSAELASVFQQIAINAI